MWPDSGLEHRVSRLPCEHSTTGLLSHTIARLQSIDNENRENLPNTAGKVIFCHNVQRKLNHKNEKATDFFLNFVRNNKLTLNRRNTSNQAIR